MKMNAAVLWEFNAEWSVEELDLDGPQDGEVLVSFEAAGLCHSDHHVRTGDLPVPLPIVGGHEGAGVVQEVGPGVGTCRSATMWWHLSFRRAGAAVGVQAAIRICATRARCC